MVRAWIIGFLHPTLLEESNSRGQFLSSLDAQSPYAEHPHQEEAFYMMPAIETHHASHANKVSVFKVPVQSLSRLPICGRHHPKIWPPDVAVDGAREQSPTEPRKVKHGSGDVPWSPAISSGFLSPIQGRGRGVKNFLYPWFSRMFTIHQGMDFHDPWIQQAVDLRMGSHDMIQVMRRSLGHRRKD